MKITIILFLSLFLINVHPLVFAEEPQTFTNKDLEKYESPSDDTTQPSYLEQNKPNTLNDKFKEIKNEYDMEYWCIWGNFYNEQVDRAQKRYDEAKDSLSEIKSAYFRKNADKFDISLAERNLEWAEKKLEEAEEELSEFEMRAYRQGVPASWHRCQYD